MTPRIKVFTDTVQSSIIFTDHVFLSLSHLLQALFNLSGITLLYYHTRIFCSLFFRNTLDAAVSLIIIYNSADINLRLGFDKRLSVEAGDPI